MDKSDLYDETWERKTGVSQVVGMVNNPDTIYVYFGVDEERKELTARHFCSHWSELPLYLCIYDVTGVWFDGYNAPLVRQIQVPSDAESWYVHGLEPDRNYVIDLATTTIGGRLFSIVRSDVVTLPPTRTATAQLHAKFMPVPSVANESIRYPYENEFDGYHFCEQQGEH
ncbi:DUF4912 domain-containing protein [Alicyclobacillus dauci]|uniref:DUF4912 domain-containing protein n=1 Tax=Alicyclobacillus dauci TaxID=1475485 RepID=A0ABY6Z4S2_9BACL|nr:DUF4912 domain-containing protein [Alicyclobacillus dauci]WAH37657.1 DUF4912 domain-containing protein [Alicyclobacillus dauci]